MAAMGDTQYDPLNTVKRVDRILSRSGECRTRRDYRIVIERLRAEVAGTIGYWTEREGGR